MPQYQSIVVLTGAGVSAESGLKTFRDNNGLWENHRVEDVCTPEAFAKNPTLVQRFYNARRAQLLNDAMPNPAHRALADFEQRFDGEYLLVTQNVDNLHEQAGSKNVRHMHGELLKVECTASGNVYSWQKDISTNTPCPCCQVTGNLRPHIVWFGEVPLHMAEIQQALSKCELFVAIGTSGHVYPAAGFVDYANAAGAHTVELNLEPSEVGSNFAQCHYGPAGTTIKPFFERLI